MEEKKDISLIKNLANVAGGKVGDLFEKIKKARQEMGGVTKKLSEKESALRKKRESEEAAARALLAEASASVESTDSATVEQPSKAVKKPAEEKKAEAKVEVTDKKDEKPVEKTEKVKKNKDNEVEVKAFEDTKSDSAIKAEPKQERIAEEKKAEIKVEATEEVKTQPTKQQPTEKAQPQVKEFVPSQERPEQPKKYTGQVGVCGRPERPERPKQYTGQVGVCGRPERPKQYTGQVGYCGPDKSQRGRRQGQTQQQGQTGFNRPQGGAQGTRPQGQGQGGFKCPIKPQEIAFIPKDSTKGVNKKKNDGRSYDDKRAINKKSALKGQVSIADFDENKTGYRKLRVKKAKTEAEPQRIKIDKAVVTKDIIPLKELSEKIGVSAVEISKILFKEGIIKTINDSIDFDTAAYVAAGLGIELELKMEKTAEEALAEGFNEEADDPADCVTRPPVVTVMGHVDHGKTSLLDYIRSAHVTAGEAGGITQHIGAYSVNYQGHPITFIDTPGHAAFTSMRQRGAQVTDIAVIVIAADDGIMPQTVEAINHAKAANVSVIIAANKIDKPHADVEKIKKQLADMEILVEEWGGDVILCPVSAKTGEGVDGLLESILLVAEMRELKANPNRKAKGAVLEAKLDKGKGPVASILVQNGTLRTGDYIVAGTSTGKVRAMFDDKGRMVKEAGPSVAVSVIGLEEVPNAGDIIFAVEQEKLSKLVAAERKNKEREEMIRRSEKVTLDDLFSKIGDGTTLNLNIIIKADVQGSVEAVKQSLTELSNAEVKINVIHAAVGAINETDVMLADSSNSIIIGFNVRPDAKAKALAERTKTDIKLYRIIYEAIDDIKAAMKGMLAPKFTDVYMGKAEVRETFKITGVGTVAGCYVTDGKIVRSGKLRIYRDDVMICEGNVLQLKRFKDDVKEVAAGYECGMSIENFNDIKIGDFIECYIVEEKKD